MQTGLDGARASDSLACCLGVLLGSFHPKITSVVLSSAYWQVASFVAATLLVFYWFQRSLKRQGILSKLQTKSPAIQVVFASLMGVLPGCGGAIIVMTNSLIRSALAPSSPCLQPRWEMLHLLIATQPAAAVIVPFLPSQWRCLWLNRNQIHPADFMAPAPTTVPAKRMIRGQQWSGTLGNTSSYPPPSSLYSRFQMDGPNSTQQGVTTLVGTHLRSSRCCCGL